MGSVAQASHPKTDELCDFGGLWREVHFDMGPFCLSVLPDAATDTVTGSSAEAVDKLILHLLLREKVARLKLEDATVTTLQSYSRKLLDIMQSQTWTATQAKVTTPK